MQRSAAPLVLVRLAGCPGDAPPVHGSGAASSETTAGPEPSPSSDATDSLGATSSLPTSTGASEPSDGSDTGEPGECPAIGETGATGLAAVRALRDTSPAPAQWIDRRIRPKPSPSSA